MNSLAIDRDISASSTKILIQLNIAICALSYWTIIIAPYFLYKTYYIATAIALFFTALLVLIGVLRTDSLLNSALPIILYFAYLFLTMLWAIYPWHAFIAALIDLIFLFVFCLFYIIGLNNSFSSIANIFILAAFPCIPDVLFFSSISMEKFGRIGYGSIYYILPYAVPFCLWKIKVTKGHRGFIALLLILALILISQSRTPILIAALTIPITIIFLTKNFRTFIAYFLKIGLALIICVGILLSFSETRSYLQESLLRFKGQKTEHLGMKINEDYLRLAMLQEGLDMLVKVQPLGVGYENFRDLMEKRFGVVMAMHSTQFAWLLEGGIPLFIIGLYIIYRSLSNLFTVIKSSDDEREKDFYKVVMISMVGVIVHGFFHMAHRNPAFYILLGIAYSAPYRRNIYGRVQSYIADKSTTSGP